MRRKRLAIISVSALVVAVPCAWLAPTLIAASHDRAVLASIAEGDAARLRRELTSDYDVHSRFMVAAEDSFLRLVKRRINREPWGEPLVIYAARVGTVGTIKELIRAGAGPDENDCGITALFWATERNDIPMASYLLEVGANPCPTSGKDGAELIRAEKNEASRFVVAWRERHGGTDKAATPPADSP